MSKELEIFKNNPLANSSLFDELMEANKKMMGGGGSNRRISIRGGRFRQIVGGEQTAISKNDNMNIIIVDAAEVARTFYAGAWDPNNIKPPTCWSVDTQKPDPSVPEKQRQAADCRSCKQNIKGSGQGDTRACRFSQRVAVLVEGDLDTIYQLQLPATSIFGKPDGDRMPLQAYVRHLAAHRTVAQGIVTKMYFDENSESPKLFFKPERPLTEAEVMKVLEQRKSDDTQRAITLTVSQTDGVQDFVIADDDDEPKPKAKKVEAEDEEQPGLFGDDDTEEEVEEPKKAAKKSKPAPAEEKGSLDELVSVWDD